MPKKTKKQIEKEEQLYHLITLVAGDFSLQEVLGKLAEAVVKIAGVKACSIRLLDENTGELAMRSAYGLSREYQDKGVVSKNDPVIKAAFAGQAVVLDDMRVNGRVKYKEATIKEGLVSQLTVAMQFRSKAIGVLRLYSPKPMRFDQDDIALARAVASQCAVAITNAKLYAEAIEGSRIAEQMRLAGIIQRRMIPRKAPLIPSLDIGAVYIPCFDVGGDFYDFFSLSDTCIALAVADVMGKGIPAALMMSLFRGAVRAYADEEYEQNNVENFVNKINKMACAECTGGEFVTLFYAAIDVQRMNITYCNCGHEPAVLIRNGKIIELDKGGLVLGVDPHADYEIGNIELKDKDCLMFYTDGLIDAADFEGRFWGRERLLETALKFNSSSAEQLAKNILTYRRRFVGLAKQIDDTSIVVVKVDRTASPKGGS